MPIATMRSSRTFGSPLIWGAAWVAAAAAGMGLFHRSMHTPGEASTPPAQQAASQAPKVMFFAHPHCGCTTPSIDTLASITAESSADVAVVLSGPAADRPDWQTTPNAKRTLQHSHLDIVHDPGGSLAERYGAHTSGHTVIYASSGDLVFSGGLSSARGMRGPSQGLGALEAALNDSTPAVSSAPVFGCRIADTSARSAQTNQARLRTPEGALP
ncbi:MAG: hypothetical protein AAF937_06175 [Planctomycetota bacterium]